MSLAEEISKLHVLYTSTAITEEEYTRAKNLLLSGMVPNLIRVEGEPARERPTNFLHQFTRSSDL